VLHLEYCRFHSNSPGNTVVFWKSELANETYHCLEFYNNTVVSNPSAYYHGLISLFHHCWFTDCYFVQNHVDVLVARTTFQENNQDVELVRCVFDEFPTWSPSDAAFALVLRTQSCIRRTETSPVDLGSCLIDTRFYCFPERCGAECENSVEIIDCVFEDCHATGHGGAIYGDRAESSFLILRCGFLHCTTDEYGGGIYLDVSGAVVRAADARQCSAGPRHSFAYLNTRSTGTNALEMNESSCFGGESKRSSLAVSSQDNAKTPITLVSLNSSLNLVFVGTLENEGWGSGLDVGNRVVLVLQYCRFHSNSPGNTLVLWKSDQAEETYRCLEFWNNTVVGEPSKQFLGLVSVYDDCRFADCRFVKNSVDFVITRTKYQVKPPKVDLLRCVYDEVPRAPPDVWEFGAVMRIDHGSLTIDTEPVELDSCRLDPPFDCQRYECGGCLAFVEIKDCFFQELWAQGSGGAIFGNRWESSFVVLRCRFLECSAGQRCGAMWLDVFNSTVNAFDARICSAGERQGCALFSGHSAGKGVMEMNESSGALCSGPAETLASEHVDAQDQPGLGPVMFVCLNLTGNYVTQGRASGLWVDHRTGLVLRFVRFHSNLGSNTMILSDIPFALEIYECIEFVNNSVSSESAVIVLDHTCEFRQCLFVANPTERLVAYGTKDDNLTVTFILCVFDREFVFGVTFETESCWVAPDPSVWQRFTCPMTPGFQASSNPSKSDTLVPSDEVAPSSNHESVALDASIAIDSSANPAPTGAFTTSADITASSNPATTAAPAPSDGIDRSSNPKSAILDASALFDPSANPPPTRAFTTSADILASLNIRITDVVPPSSNLRVSELFESGALPPSGSHRGSLALTASAVYLATALRSSGTILASAALIESGVFESEAPPASSRPQASLIFPDTPTFIASPTFAPTDVFPPTAQLAATDALAKSREPGQTTHFTPSTALAGKELATEQKTSVIWLSLGLALAILALIALAVFVILFVKRRKTETQATGDQDSSSTDGPATWNDTINDDDEEFVDYVNPLEFSGARED
jgi:hypothetical protein